MIFFYGVFTYTANLKLSCLLLLDIIIFISSFMFIILFSYVAFNYWFLLFSMCKLFVVLSLILPLIDSPTLVLMLLNPKQTYDECLSATFCSRSVLVFFHRFPLLNAVC